MIGDHFMGGMFGVVSNTNVQVWPFIPMTVIMTALFII